MTATTMTTDPAEPKVPRMRRIAHWLWEMMPPIAFAALVLTIWQLYCTLADVRESVLPAPTDIANALWTERTLLFDNSWVTIKEIALGYTAAVIIGVGVGTVIATSRRIERAVSPWLVISQMVPIPAIAPLIVIWTGFDIRPKVIVIALVSFFPIAVNTIDGLKSTEPEMINLLKTLGAGRRRQFRIARLPAAMPFIFAGLKIAAAFSVIGAVFAEWVGASEGLGYLILTLNNQTATTEMFAAIVALALIGIGLYALIGLIERLTLPWYYEARQDGAEGGKA